jgi:dTDP-4-dehydrorhamnose 3,5-epimerase
MPFRFRALELPGLVLVEAEAREDRRGLFMEVYRRSEFAAHGVPGTFVQDNYSSSAHRVLRGLHYQRPPRAQGKLVLVLRGEIFDVAVDLRHGSPTYGRWAGVVLSSANRRMLYVPEGFAHGFCVTGDQADVVYKATAEYAPELEGGVRWDDPEIGVRWPVAEPILSERDAALPPLRDAARDAVREGQR